MDFPAYDQKALMQDLRRQHQEWLRHQNGKDPHNRRVITMTMRAFRERARRRRLKQVMRGWATEWH